MLRLTLNALFADTVGEWSYALELFVIIQTDKIKPDVVTWNVPISASMNGGNPDTVSREKSIYTSSIE